LLEQKLDHVAGIGQNFNWQPLAVGTDSTKKNHNYIHQMIVLLHSL
jgi:hypothetical protein